MITEEQWHIFMNVGNDWPADRLSCTVLYLSLAQFMADPSAYLYSGNTAGNAHKVLTARVFITGITRIDQYLLYKL